jgi:PQQ-dependent catabolism-associated beta-propeller protein
MWGLTLTAAACVACDSGGNAHLAAPGPKDAKQLLVLVSNEDSNDISFIDEASDAVVRSVPVGKRPRGLKVSRDGRKLYVALSGSPRGGPNVDESTLPPPDRGADGIGVMDLESAAMQTRLPSGNDPETVDSSPDGRLLAVANEDSAQVRLLDADTGAVIANIPVGLEPEGLQFRPDGRYVYVTSEANDRIDVIDVNERRVTTVIPTGKRPRNVLFSPDGKRAYVTCELAERVDVIDAIEHRALTSIEIVGTPKAMPMGMALDDSAQRLYVSLGRAGEVAVIDTGAFRLIQRIADVGKRPWGIALTPDGDKIYTANGPSGDVSVIDARSLRVIRKIPVGKQPWGLGLVRVKGN